MATGTPSGLHAMAQFSHVPQTGQGGRARVARHHSDETVLTRCVGFGGATCTNIPLCNPTLGVWIGTGSQAGCKLNPHFLCVDVLRTDDHLFFVYAH